MVEHSVCMHIYMYTLIIENSVHLKKSKDIKSNFLYNIYLYNICIFTLHRYCPRVLLHTKKTRNITREINNS